MRGLSSNTVYYARFVAKNSAGDETYFIEFKTLPIKVPEVDKVMRVTQECEPTFALAALSPTSARFRAEIDTNGAQSEYSFEYALSEAGPWSPFSSGAAGTITAAEEYAKVEAALAGLAPETKYYVRIKAKNEVNGKVEEVVQTKYAYIGCEGTNFFTTLTNKPGLGVPEARNVTAESARVVAGISTHGFETEWRMEYSSEPGNASSWVTVPGAEGTISQTEAEAMPYFSEPKLVASLVGLSPSKIYYVRLSASKGEILGSAGRFETSGSPSATAFAVHGLHDESVRLMGAVNPNNLATSAEQTITVSGSSTGGTFTLSLEGHVSNPIAYNASSEAVGAALRNLVGEPSVSVAGLDGGPYTVFFFGKDGGESKPPIVGDGSGLTPSGTVNVAIDFQGGEANDIRYHFEYVSEKGFAEHGWEGAQRTKEEDIGSSGRSQSVGVDVPDLEAGETYRYHMIASSAVPDTSPVDSADQTLVAPVASRPAVESCPNEVFRMGVAVSLPDCRAYEVITPVDKEGAQEPFRYRGGTIASSVLIGEGTSTNAVLQADGVSWGKSVESGQGPYFFDRGEAADWLMTPGSPQPETGVVKPEPQLYNADLTKFAFASGYNESPLSESPLIDYKVGIAGGPYETVVSVPRKVIGERDGWIAANGDFSKLVLQTQDRTLLGKGPTGTTSGPDLYEYTTRDGLHQLNVDSHGHTIGVCGAKMAHGEEEGARFHVLSGPHSISVDGSRVFFEAVPSNNCSEPPHLYARLGGVETSDIGVYKFLAANAQGSKIILGNGSGEVFLYDVATRIMVVLPGAQEGVVSEDLSAIYFAAGQLTSEAPQGSGEVTDIYRYDVLTKTLRFVVQAIPKSTAELIGYVSPDGHLAYFGAEALGGLPGGRIDPNGNRTVQVYRYDSVTNVVQCVSCASSSDPEPDQSAFLGSLLGRPFTPGGLPDPVYVSADGDFAFFTTPAALVRQDVNGEVPIEFDVSEKGGEYNSSGRTSPSSDVYEWRASGVDGCGQVEGCVGLITDGSSGYLNLLLGSADEGRDVFVYTRSKLVPQDTDTSGDIYDVRVDGGESPPSPRPTECEGDTCSTPPSSPNDSTPSSFTFSGLGNAVSPSTKKPKFKSKGYKHKKKRHNKKVRKKNRKVTKRLRGVGKQRSAGSKR